MLHKAKKMLTTKIESTTTEHEVEESTTTALYKIATDIGLLLKGDSPLVTSWCTILHVQ